MNDFIITLISLGILFFLALLVILLSKKNKRRIWKAGIICGVVGLLVTVLFLIFGFIISRISMGNEIIESIGMFILVFGGWAICGGSQCTMDPCGMACFITAPVINIIIYFSIGVIVYNIIINRK